MTAPPIQAVRLPRHHLRRWTYLALVAALLAQGLVRVESAHAATFTVTTTQDAPHTTPLDGN
jgi:hypothetical protein